MMSFFCNKCGLCCKNLDKSEIYAELNRGDGICIYLIEKNNLCSIYSQRPDICNVKKMYELYYRDKMSLEDYYRLNSVSCELLKKISKGEPMLSKEDKDGLKKKYMIGGSIDEIVQRYGDAASEYIIAYLGENRDLGIELTKGLKEISRYKINNDYADSNIKQQAGFSAELLQVAKVNSENIIDGKTERLERTDDLGKVNDQLLDHETVRAGKIIPKSGTQSKFIGKTSDACFNKLISSKCEKYFDHDVPVEIPSDFYEDVIKKFDFKESDLKKQIGNLKKQGKLDIAEQKQKELSKLKKIKRLTKKSKVSSKEAIDARLQPEKVTFNNVRNTSIKAGKEAAKAGTLIGGSISIIQNLYALSQNDKTIGTALIDISKDTAKTALFSFSSGCAGGAIKSVMINSKQSSVRALSKSNLPAQIVTIVTETSKTITKFFKGEIDQFQFFGELGEKGTGLLASSLGATIGQLAIPVPIAGAMIGSFIGYSMSSIFYQAGIEAFRNQKIAKERRIMIEEYCSEAIRQMTIYEEKLKEYYQIKEIKMKTGIDNGLQKLNLAIEQNNVNEFANALNSISETFNKTIQFSNFKEFDSFMQTDAAIDL